MKKNVSKRLILSFYAFIFIVSAFNILVYLSMRPFWYFINRDTSTPLYPKLPFSTLVFTLYVVFLAYSLILFIVFINKQKSLIKRPSTANVIIPLILGVLLSAFNIYIYTQMGGDQYLVSSYLRSASPYVLILLLLFILIFFNPKFKISQIPIFYYSAILATFVILLLNITDFGKVKITSGPNIQALDNNSIAILWTTNENSTSYVEYGPDKEHLKRAFMSIDGLVDANTKIHKVLIPLEHHSSIIYRVVSTKINRYYQNNVDYGNIAESDFKKYIDYTLKDKLVFYILNDVHENKNIYKKFLSKNDYDFVVLNGDAVNTLDSTSDIIDKILKPLSIFNNGEKPFYFVRGNHEPRGGAARSLPNYLALPNNHYYYTFNSGPVFGIVLDSGEDKLDDDKEYSGLADFKNYRMEETKWLQSIYESNVYKNSKYKIAFVHIPLNADDNNIAGSYLKTYQKEWRELLNKIKINAVFSGHTHVPVIIKPDYKEFNFPIIIGGGPTDNEKEYIAIRTEITPKEMKVFFVNFDGSVKEVYNILKH